MPGTLYTGIRSSPMPTSAGSELPAQLGLRAAPVPAHALHDGNRAVQVRVGHRGAARQAQAALEQARGDGAAAIRAAGEDRLHVERLPERAGLDVRGFERPGDVVAIGAE